MKLTIQSADIHRRIPSQSPSQPCADYSIIIRRGYNGLEGYVAYYPSDEDAWQDNKIILDVWDRESFREAYRHARLWCVGGIGYRVLRAGGAA